jgi:hypothetical protein
MSREVPSQGSCCDSLSQSVLIVRREWKKRRTHLLPVEIRLTDVRTRLLPVDGKNSSGVELRDGADEDGIGVLVALTGRKGGRGGSGDCNRWSIRVREEREHGK